MNTNFLRLPRACAQSEQEIWHVIRQARGQQVEQQCSVRLPWPFTGKRNAATECQPSGNSVKVVAKA